MLQFPWLLTGVVIVETLFNYNGFGWTLVQAASNNDIELLLACSIVAVFVVLVTQLISDIGYVFLNPRIRISKEDRDMEPLSWSGALGPILNPIMLAAIVVFALGFVTNFLLNARRRARGRGRRSTPTTR
jgi:hypothetical protein